MNSKGFPTPLSTLDSALTLFADPFYQDGPNDMGIGWNVLASLQRVAVGFGLAALAGIPLGFLIGRSLFFARMFNPLIALLRRSARWPGCPSACCCSRKRNPPPAGPFLSARSGRWSLTPPRACGAFGRLPQRRPGAAAVGVDGDAQDPLSGGIARGADRGSSLHRYRLAGDCRRRNAHRRLRIGFWIWNEWNNLNVENIIIAIVIIGVVGLLLEQGLMLLARRFSWQEK